MECPDISVAQFRSAFPGLIEQLLSRSVEIFIDEYFTADSMSGCWYETATSY